MSNGKNSYGSLSDNTLADLSKKGDDNAFNELSMRYLSLISAIARKYSAQGYEQKDFVQEGLLGLLYSCRTFDSNEKSGFKNYVAVVVERRFISIIRRSNTLKAVPVTALVRIDDIEESIEDSAQSPEELITCKEHLSHVLERLKLMLSKTEYDVLMLYGSGMSYKEIASRMSMSEKSADNALQRARRKICNVNMS